MPLFDKNLLKICSLPLHVLFLDPIIKILGLSNLYLATIKIRCLSVLFRLDTNNSLLRTAMKERISQTFSIGPDYDAPLYLDCCALVRRVLRDMKTELGFCIGRWNQAYQA